MGDTRQVSEGLRLIYLGNMITIITIVCTPVVALLSLGLLVGVLAAVVLMGSIVALVGLARLRNEHPDYMKALIALVVAMVAGVFAGNSSAFGMLMSIVKTVGTMVEVYFVVRATNSFLNAKWFREPAAMGDRAWKWQVISLGVDAATVLVILILPLLGILMIVVNLVVSIAALVFYLIYLKTSAAVLA